MNLVENGFDYRPSEPRAALGCAQMRRLQRMLDGRRGAADLYTELLGGAPSVHDAAHASRGSDVSVVRGQVSALTGALNAAG